MATWTQKQANIYNSGSVRYAATDGTDIYYVAGTVIYKYTVATNSYAAISDGSSWGGATGGSFPLAHLPGAGIVWFKGDLYVARWGNGTSTGDKAQVWRWDGSGTTWTKVFSSNAGGGGYSLFASADIMVLLNTGGATFGGFYSDDTWYTSDGSSWTQGSVNGGDTTIGEVGAGRSSMNGTQNGIFAWIEYGTPSLPYSDAIFKFNETTYDWERVSEVDPTFNYHMFCRDFHWQDIGPGTSYEWTADFAGWDAPTNSNVRPVHQINMPYDVGFVFGAVSPAMYLWDSGADEWGAGETIFVGTNATIHHFIRLSDNNVFAIIEDSSGNNEIWQRDEALPDPVTSTGLQFYSGVNSLTYRSDLPFDEIDNPDCMLVRADDSVIVGASAAGGGGELVASGSAGDDYASWTDITGSIADPITAVKEV